jgi:putative flippase GtrA
LTLNIICYIYLGVSEIHGITLGMNSSYVGNKNSLYQPRSKNAVFEFLRCACDTKLFTLPHSKCSICPPPA